MAKRNCRLPAKHSIMKRLSTACWQKLPPLLGGILVFATALWAQQSPATGPAGIGNLDSVSVSGDTLTIRSGGDTVIAQMVDANMLRVNYRRQGKTSPATPVLDPNRIWRSDVPAKIETSSDPIVISTDRMKVKIARTPVRFAIYDGGNHLLLQEPAEGGVSAGGLRFTYNSASPFFGIKGIGMAANNVSAPEDLRRGMRRSGGAVLAGSQGDGGAPLAFTTTYGLLVDSDGGNFDISNGNLQFGGDSRTDIEYFIIVGDPKTILHGVADITGHPPMMPKWTLGFMNSQWGTNQAEVTQIIATYRAKRIPIDGFILDFDWKAWGEDDYGEWRWNSTSGAGNVHPNKYPDGASGKFAQAMKDQGIKLAGIYKPRILLHNAQGGRTVAAQYAYDHKLFFDSEKPYEEYFSKRPALDIDFSKAQARSWFWEHMLPAYGMGIRYFWNDEADAISDITFPNFQHANMARAMYDGVRSIGEERVWTINRNFYLGGQRYAYAEWSGDIQTGFDSMAGQAPRMLSTINLGEPHWSMDTGGFVGHPSAENYARWMEFAAFVPIMRVHGNFNEHRQPWVYGSQAEADAKAAIELRYRLMPYMYAYEREAHESGVGMVRPLFWDFPDNTTENAYRTDEWMFGDELLVAPVLSEGQAQRSIYLPQGEWIDYFRGRRYQGNKVIEYSVDPNTWLDIPLFIRQGAIIPSQEVEQYVGERPVSRIYVDVFATGKATTFTYYDDDGTTYAYEKGAFYQQKFSTSDNGKAVHFDSTAPQGTYKSPLHEYEVRLHGIRARVITIDGVERQRYADIPQLEGQTNEGWTVSTDRYGDVTCVKLLANSAKRVVATY
ncbi:MAG TPA: TIM-barrel domain-containing protein [Candidatus Angelobacter sp.]